MKKRQIILTVLVLALAGGAYLLLSGLKEEEQVKQIPEVKKYVRTKTVSYRDIQTHVIAYGRVQTAHSLDLLSEVSGRVFTGSVPLKSGQNFKKGTLLFYIDAREAALNLQSQKSTFLSDLAAVLPDLKIDFQQSFSTWTEYFNSIDLEKDLPPLPEVRDSKEKTFFATKGIFSSYYTIKSAEVRLKKHYFYAPFDGSISEVLMESGAFINPGTKIGTIMQSGSLELKVAVETKDIPWIQRGAPASIFSEETQMSWEGEVVRISDFVNENTQSVDVYVRIFSSKQKIYDGQFLEASIPARIIRDGMEIPRQALYNGNEVFVLQDTLLKVRDVTIHRLMDESAIFSGLEEGEELVVEPLVSAHNNMKAFKMESEDIDLESKESKEIPLPGEDTSSGNVASH